MLLEIQDVVEDGERKGKKKVSSGEVALSFLHLSHSLVHESGPVGARLERGLSSVSIS